MSKYDYNYGEETPKPKQKAASADAGLDIEIWDVLSALTLLFTVFLVFYFAAVFISPGAAYNVLKPRQFKITPTVTPTPLPLTLPPTWTPTVTPVLSETPTLFPTFTPIPTATPFSLIPPTKTPTVTKTPKAPYAITFEGIKSSIIHPEFGCDWQAVGGTIVDANNADMIGMIINLTGYYNGKALNELTVSGVAPAYGKSGFEFYLGNQPVSLKGQLYLQLLDQAGSPLSQRAPIDVYADCGQNLTLVRFVKNP